MKTVVFGAGYWGQNYVRELVGNLTAVVEIDKGRADYIQQHYNVPVYPELPDDLKFDAAIVAVPPESHVSVALPLLKQGKYVLIEKPLATSMKEAELLIPHTDRCMVMQLYAYHPIIEDMREWLVTHDISHIITRRSNQGPVRPWQDALWDLASHDIAILNDLTIIRRPYSVDAYGYRDWAVIHMSYGEYNTISYVSWLGLPKCRKIELVARDCPDRFVFDDIATKLDITPLRRLLDVFLSGTWGYEVSVDMGIEVVAVLEDASQRMRLHAN